MPIIDCYLDKEHNSQYITMGPILTIAEIKMIEKLEKVLAVFRYQDMVRVLVDDGVHIFENYLLILLQVVLADF